MKLLKIYIVEEIPQEFTSSDKTCYHPYSKSIYIRKDQYKFWTVIHELIHYAIDLLPASYDEKHPIQKLYDYLCWERNDIYKT